MDSNLSKRLTHKDKLLCLLLMLSKTTRTSLILYLLNSTHKNRVSFRFKANNKAF